MVDRISRRSALGAGAVGAAALGLAACGGSGGGDTAEAPPELLAALAEDDLARTAFEKLRGSARYSVLHPVLAARDARARERAVARAVLRLRGDGPGTP